MVKTLSSFGNDLGIVIDPSLLDQLGIDRDTPLEVTVDGKGLYIRPIEQDHPSRVLQIAERVMDVHDETLRKLAQ